MVNHSNHFIGIPKRSQLWEVQSNIVRRFVTMNGEIQKCYGKFCLVPICVLRPFSSSITMDGVY